MKESIVFLREWMDAIRELPSDVRLEAYEAIIEYGTTGIIPEGLSPMAKLALNFAKSTLDKNSDKYEATRKKRAEAGRRHNGNQYTEVPGETSAAPTAQVEQNGTNGTNVPCAEQMEQTEQVSQNGTNGTDNVNVNVNVNGLSNDNIKETANAVKKARAAPLEDRAKEFYESLVPFVGKYGKETLRDFYEYWSEPTQDKKKMRWELQRTWSVSRRLRTWREKEREINNRNRYEASRGNTQAAAEQRADEAAAIVARLAAENSYD